MDSIQIIGARQHHLKNINVTIPRGKLVVITGPSGCGKSSLAFHTLFAEGQRRYVESLSIYARQFLDQLEKPDVDRIEGLSPAIAIEQYQQSLNPRSTIATATEIYDYLKVLWAAVGTPFDPTTGEELQRMGAKEIHQLLSALAPQTKVTLLAPLALDAGISLAQQLDSLVAKGFLRVRLNGIILEIEQAAREVSGKKTELELVIDRLVIRDGVASRLADSIETAMRWSEGETRAWIERPEATGELLSFQHSYRHPLTGFTVSHISPKLFSFNAHLGACSHCEGLGTELYCDETLLFGDATLPILKGGIQGWWRPKTPRETQFHKEMKLILAQENLSDEASFKDLAPEIQQLILHGGKVFDPNKQKEKMIQGLCPEALEKYRHAASEASRRRLLRVMAHKSCTHCKGLRLNEVARSIKIRGADSLPLGIQDFCALSVDEASDWLSAIVFQNHQLSVASSLQQEVLKRLYFLKEVGLHYLSLDRHSKTLSGGEAQRIRLATQLGAGLSGVIYVLDEPSIGLHAADSQRLIQALLRLRDLGNTLVVVEHDESIIRAADWLIELGPGAGKEGGQLVAEGKLDAVDCPTTQWLKEKRSLSAEATTTLKGYLTIFGAQEHHLKNLDVQIPLGQLVAICGPSGSGKSTIIHDILKRSLMRYFRRSEDVPGKHDRIEGMSQIQQCILVDQQPIGRSPRSNPATFTGVFDHIRNLFAQLPLSRQRGYTASRFSFNAAGGRCERCQGNGKIKIEMHFLPDAWIECAACNGKRFNHETLEILFKGYSIADILTFSIQQALEFFKAIPKIKSVLAVLEELGLGYLQLGQAAHTLSGGEAQRLKLALELAKTSTSHTLYLLDEPSTGLHFGDVERLINALKRLRQAGHSVLVIEHHLDIILAADHIIELGPTGGKEGGYLMANGSLVDFIQLPESPTAKALRTLLIPS